MLPNIKPLPSGDMHEDFIEVFDNAFTPEQCERLIKRLKRGGPSALGKVDGGVRDDSDDLVDVPISGRADWRDVETELNLVMLKGLTAYLRRYPYALIAPVSLNTPDVDGQSRRLTAEDLVAMGDDELSALARLVFVPGPIVLRHYRVDTGGYPYWHRDLHPRDASGKSMNRYLFWALYLNSDFAEGETEFLYQRRKITPCAGSLLIAPAVFTHTHRGHRPRQGDQFMATGWIQLQRSEKLYGY